LFEEQSFTNNLFACTFLKENAMETLILDNTKRAVFKQCKKKYLLSVINGWQSNYGSTALRYGVAWHGMQEGYYSWIVKHGWPKTATERMEALTQGLELGKKKWDKETEKKTFLEDYKSFNTAVDAFQNYLEFFQQDANAMKILQTEQVFQCPINPETVEEDKLLSSLPPIIFTGRIDLVIEMDYATWLLDFKTTGWILSQVIQKANRSPQLIGYTYASKQILDFQVSGCILSFAYAGASKLKSGDYGSVRFDFRRIPQIYTGKDIQAWKFAFIDTCREIVFSMKEDSWPEGFDNCYQFGSCPYLKLCQQHVPYDKLDFTGFHQEFWDVRDED
jgi:hypothetical protein